MMNPPAHSRPGSQPLPNSFNPCEINCTQYFLSCQCVYHPYSVKCGLQLPQSSENAINTAVSLKNYRYRQTGYENVGGRGGITPYRLNLGTRKG